ncbi:MAG: thiamine biosynthesis lipoprotein [Streptosporangiaceae bacterium]|jgi:thiamine biosynthesis lipoprotein|nr:thiamine biosynthesis lipoprotein [Streptosporangiaceae bacterium]
MGTVFSFDVRAEPTPGLFRALADATAWLRHVDAVFSTYRPDSQISRLGRSEVALTDCEPDVAEVLRLCDQAARVSGGRFSVHVGPGLDPSAMVKGWAVERAAQMLSRAGARDHCVNGGGDLQLTGGAGPGRPWRIGVAHPLLPGRLATVVAGRDLAVATSGTAERGHHIFDPRTGRPATALASMTLVGRDLTTVDAQATAAFVMGESAREWVEDALEDIEAFAVTADGRTWWTAGFPEYGIVPR